MEMDCLRCHHGFLLVVTESMSNAVLDRDHEDNEETTDQSAEAQLMVKKHKASQNLKWMTHSQMNTESVPAQGNNYQPGTAVTRQSAWRRRRRKGWEGPLTCDSGFDQWSSCLHSARTERVGDSCQRPESTNKNQWNSWDSDAFPQRNETLVYLHSYFTPGALSWRDVKVILYHGSLQDGSDESY